MNSGYEEGRLWLPKHSCWRQFKLQLQDGRVINVPKRIRSKTDFREILLSYSPKHVWFGVTCWLNPLQVKGNQTGSWNVSLFRDLIFDIDAKLEKGETITPEKLDEARGRTLFVLNTIKQDLGEPTYIIYSGNKGFEIVYEHSIKTKRYLEEKRYCKISQLIDLPITEDRFRVIRLPLTINGTSGNRAIFLEAKDLNKSADFILKKAKGANQLACSTEHSLPYTCPNREAENHTSKSSSTQERPSASLHTHQDLDGSPLSRGRFPAGETRGDDGRQTSPPTLEQAGLSPGLGEPAITTYLTNKITATKRFILFLTYPKQTNWRRVEEEISGLSNMFDLGNAYVMLSRHGYGVVFLKAHDEGRLHKIYSHSNSTNRFSFKKNNLVCIPITEGWLTKDGVRMALVWEPLFSKNLVSGEDNNIYSRPHADLLRKLGFQVRERENLIGEESLVYEKWQRTN